MSDTIQITEKQSEWLQRVLDVSIGMTALEEEEEPRVDEYGVAYKSFDPRDAPGKLKDGAMLSPTDWGGVATELAGERKAFMDDYTNKLAGVKATGQKPTQKMAACLPVLDAPENNPERDKVGALLSELDALAKEMAKPLPGSMTSQEVLAKQQEFAKQKGDLLNQMSREIAEWINRRAEQGQPPPREAVAMGDIVQAEHQKLIKEYLDKGWSPPPIADADQMTTEELAEVKKIWDRLASDSGTVKFPTSRPTDPTDRQYFDLGMKEYKDKVSGTNLSDEDLKQFRVEMLSGMARLLGSPSGRDLLNQIEAAGQKGGKRLQMIPGDSPACVGVAAGNAAPDANVENPEPEKRGAGAHTAVMYLPGGKDSYRAYNMDDGNFLFAPTNITLAHELTHALHNLEGTNRSKLPLGSLDPKWNNPEEYWTIHKGELSEQTFRQDYGLSAMRFGHISQAPKDDAANKSIKAVEDAKTLADLRAGAGSKPAVDVEKVLQEERGFTKKQVDMMTDPIKLAVIQDKTVKGPLPEGWDPTRLDPAKIKAIVKDSLPFRMNMLGWTAYNLAYSGGAVDQLDFPESIKEVTQARVHHPRSEAGRQYKAFGAKGAITAFGTFKTATGTDLGAWDGTDWRANLRTLIAADSRLNKMISGIPFVAADTDPGRKVTDKDQLTTKLTRIAAIFGNALSGKEPEKAGPLMADDALKHFGYAGDNAPDKQIAFLKEKSVALGDSDKELAKGGLSVASMTLVARDKAAKVLTAFKALRPFKTFDTHIKAATELVDAENTLQDAADQYAEVQTQLQTLDGWLAQKADTPVATAIRKLYIDDAVTALSRKPAFGAMVQKAMAKNETAATEMYRGNPKVEDILDNSRSSEAFSDWLEQTPEGKLLFDFYYMLYLRKTAEIADAAQGTALKKIGFEQDTIVRLSRDSRDEDALAKAMTEAHALMTKKLPEFLKAMAPKS